MSMIAKNNGNVSIEKLEGGVYPAVSSMIIDLGLQENVKFEKTQRKMMIMWILNNETVEINGEKLPRTMSKEYSFSLHEKSGLRKDLQAWRGKPFTDDELNGFDLLTILNKPCQLQIILEEKNGNKYNNIAGIMALPKGTKIDLLKQTCHFDLENPETWNNWEKIPSWIQEKIKKARNYESSGLIQYVKEYEEMKNKEENTTHNNTNLEPIAPDDDLPF